jgi:hypothetical protein
MVYIVQGYWACFGLYPSSCMWYFLSSTYKTMDKVQNKPNSPILAVVIKILTGFKLFEITRYFQSTNDIQSDIKHEFK